MSVSRQDAHFNWVLDREPGTSTLTTPGFVYFIRAEVTGMVKIGWATKPEARLKSLQMQSPDRLVLAATVPGTGRDEKALHERLTAHRRHGEWFVGVPEVLSCIEEAIANGPQRAWEPAPGAEAPMTLRERLKASRRP